MEIATVTSKGQVTIPKKIRDALGLKEGERLYFHVVGGELRAQLRRGRAADLVGLLKEEAREPLSRQQEKGAVAAALARKSRRAKKAGG